MDTKLSREEIYELARKGNISESILKFLGDYFDKRREQAERKICNCEAKFEALESARQELKEVRRFEQELLHNIAMGKFANDELENLKKGG